MTPPLPIPELHYKVIGTRNCAYKPCSKPFFLLAKKPRQKYCSRRCGGHEPKRKSVVRRCAAEGCGNITTRGAKWCSKECRQRTQAKARTHHCPICTQPFDHNNRAKKYCSGACLKESIRRGRKKYLCLICDCDTGGSYRNTRRYCSAKCKSIARDLKKVSRTVEPRAPYVAKKRQPTPDDLVLYARVMKIGSKRAGAERGMTKSAVNGRLWRANLSCEGAPPSVGLFERRKVAA